MVKKVIMNGYIILDSGSGVNLLPAHYQADNSMDVGSGSLGGSYRRLEQGRLNSSHLQLMVKKCFYSINSLLET